MADGDNGNDAGGSSQTGAARKSSLSSLNQTLASPDLGGLSLGTTLVGDVSTAATAAETTTTGFPLEATTATLAVTTTSGSTVGAEVTSAKVGAVLATLLDSDLLRADLDGAGSDGSVVPSNIRELDKGAVL